MPSKAFMPIQIGKLELKNRFIMAPLDTGLGEKDGFAGDRIAYFFGERVKHDVAMVMLGSVTCAPEGRRYAGQLRCDQDIFIPGLRKVTEMVHRLGGKIGCQICHGGWQARKEVTGVPPLSPSPIPHPATGEMPCKITWDKIEELANAFAEGACRCIEAGFDLLELQMAHGSLLFNFLSPLSNHRRDAFGGPLENRMRFPLLVLEKVRKAVGRGVPLTVRVCMDERYPGGYSKEDALSLCKEFAKKGVDGISISAGSYYSLPAVIPPMMQEQKFLLPYCRELKRKVRIPLIAGGRINDGIESESLLQRGCVDILALGRTLIADPEFVSKIRERKWHDIRPCIFCNQGCYDFISQGKGITCTVNARTGFERIRELNRAGKQLHIVVVGGGAAGLEAARVAAERGHRVTLVEQREVLGGKLQIASALSQKEEIYQLLCYFKKQIRCLGVEVKLQTKGIKENILALNPDAIILAMGSNPLSPEVRGLDAEHVCYAEEVLSGLANLKNRVLVAGGGTVGVETAVFLGEAGKQVALVEKTSMIARELGPTLRPLFLQRLEENSVEIMVNTKLVAIGENEVLLEGMEGEKVYFAENVVIATGYEPDNSLMEELKNEGVETYTVGDAREVGKIIDAIHDSYTTVLSL